MYPNPQVYKILPYYSINYAVYLLIPFVFSVNATMEFIKVKAIN